MIRSPLFDQLTLAASTFATWVNARGVDGAIAVRLFIFAPKAVTLGEKLLACLLDFFFLLACHEAPLTFQIFGSGVGFTTHGHLFTNMW